MGPFDRGGYLKPGKVYFAPVGTESPFDQWQELGDAGTISFDVGPNDKDADGIKTWDQETVRATRTRPPVTRTSLTFTCIPPKTRREKRERRAALRLLYGNWPTHRKPKRQLIHKGGKP